MPHVKNLIAANPAGWLEHLTTGLNINASADGDLVSLKYHMFLTDMTNSLAQECRGMVVNTKTNTILAHPFNKFWNSAEAMAAEIEWSTARVQAKEDGSLMLLFWHPDSGQWQVASSGTPTASGSVGGNTQTFAQLFWATFDSLGMKLPDSDIGFDRNTCFMLELCTRHNQIVCRHPAPRLVCLGARHVPSEQEWSRVNLESFCKTQNWELVKEYPLTTIEECIKAAEALNPMNNEGFVVVDARFNRQKIKSPQYVALHGLKGNGAMTVRRTIELWSAGEVSEFIGYFPELESDIQPTVDALESAAQSAYDAYLANRDLPTRKDFAMAIKDTKWQSVCFKLLVDKNPSPEQARAIMRGLTISALERMIDAPPLNGDDKCRMLNERILLPF